MLLGAANDAGTATTGVSVHGVDAFTLSNAAGVPLRVVPTPTESLPYGAPAGNVMVDSDGDPLISITVGGKNYVSWLYTTRWARIPVQITPVRVLDTRTAAGRSAIVSGAANVDDQGRVAGGKTILVALDALVYHGDAVRATVTVVNTVGAGYLTIWGDGARPTASSVNWWGPGQILSNFVMSPLAPSDGHHSVVAIFASQPTSVILDVVGLVVADPDQILAPTPAPLPRPGA